MNPLDYTILAVFAAVSLIPLVRPSSEATPNQAAIEGVRNVVQINAGECTSEEYTASPAGSVFL